MLPTSNLCFDSLHLPISDHFRLIEAVSVLTCREAVTQGSSPTAHPSERNEKQATNPLRRGAWL